MVLRLINNYKLGWNTDYKYHSGDAHFGWKIMAAELLGALRVMGETAPFLKSYP